MMLTIFFSLALIICVRSFQITYPVVHRHHLLSSLRSSYLISNEKIFIQKSSKLYFKGLIAPVEDTSKSPTRSPLKQLVIILKTFWKFTFLALFRVLLAPFGFIVGKIFTSKSKYLEEEEDDDESTEESGEYVELPQLTEVDRNFLKAKELAALKLKESKSIAVAKKAVQKRLLEIEKKSPTSKLQSTVTQSYPKIVTELPIANPSSVENISEMIVNSEPIVAGNPLISAVTEVVPLVNTDSLIKSVILEETNPVIEATSSPIIEEISSITNKNIAIVTSNELEMQQETQSVQEHVAIEAPTITSIPSVVESVATTVTKYEVSTAVEENIAYNSIESSIQITPDTKSVSSIQTTPEVNYGTTASPTKIENQLQPQPQTQSQLVITGPYDPNAVLNNINGDDNDYFSTLLPQSVKELNDRIQTAGVSGTVSYIGVEVMFWAASVPLAITSYHGSTGAWLSLTDPYDQGKILALTTTFAAAARIAVPFRLAAAVALMPWVEKNIINNDFFSNTTSTTGNTIATEVNDIPINES